MNYKYKYQIEELTKRIVAEFKCINDHSIRKIISTEFGKNSVIKHLYTIHNMISGLAHLETIIDTQEPYEEVMKLRKKINAWYKDQKVFRHDEAANLLQLKLNLDHVLIKVKDYRIIFEEDEPWKLYGLEEKLKKEGK